MKKPEQSTSNALLRRAREHRGWSRAYVAEKIGSDSKTVGRWERGATFPQPYYRQKLCELFGQNAQELGLIPGETNENSEQSASLSPYSRSAVPAAVETSQPPLAPTLSIWNVPYRRNPFFTGREAALNALHTALVSGKAVALTQTQAISGLGGVGKTQTAVEYAYRYQDDYRAVLWARADSRETLVSDFVSIADILKLPEKDEQDQNLVLNALNRWLKETTGWLLILDNVDDLMMVSDFLPSRGQGHALLTTREQVTGGIAQRIEIEKMDPEDGALFLLRRTHMLAVDAPRDNVSYNSWHKAIVISQELDGLPLALDQAGAFIEQTECGLAGYLERFQKHRSVLLSLRGSSVADHPEPVATTWALSFGNVQKANPVAADLLQLCAFLHPDAIPLEIITNGAPDLGPLLEIAATDVVALDIAIRELRRFSLLRRDPENQILNIHRLVQAVIKDGMDEATQRQWAERAVRAVNRAFPDAEFATWNRCQRCLPHAQVCAGFIEQWNMTFPEATRLLHQAGSYLGERAQYAQSELFLQRALVIREQTLGSEHLDLAPSLDRLMEFYFYQGKYTQAEILCRRALMIREQTLGLEHPEVAESLNNLAAIHNEQGKYTQAEPLLQRALAIWKKAPVPEPQKLASSFNNLGYLYYLQGKYTQAELLYQQALTILEQTLEQEHPDMVVNLNNLAALYRAQGKYAEAEPLFQRALAIREQTLDPLHPDVASSLNNLATIYRLLGRYAEAEPLAQRALTVREKVLGAENPYVANSLNALGQLYHAQGQYEQAEHLYQRALLILEKTLGREHPDVAQSLNDLATLYFEQSLHDKAEPLYRRALTIREKTLGSEHPDVAISLKNYADLLRKTNRRTEAAELEARAREVRPDE